MVFHNKIIIISFNWNETLARLGLSFPEIVTKLRELFISELKRVFRIFHYKTSYKTKSYCCLIIICMAKALHNLSLSSLFFIFFVFIKNEPGKLKYSFII